RSSMLRASECCGSLSNHLGIIISAAIPCATRPSVARIAARTNACDASFTVAVPKRNGMRNVTGRSKHSSEATAKRGARDAREVIGESSRVERSLRIEVLADRLRQSGERRLAHDAQRARAGQ